MNIELFVKALSDILSEKYGVVVKVKAERRESEISRKQGEDC